MHTLRSDSTGSKARIWDVAAADYDTGRLHDGLYGACIQCVADHLPRGARTCLDAGCGTGLVTAALATRCESVFAVDYSLASLVYLLNKPMGKVVSVVQANLVSLPFADSAFDVCVCANTLQHLRPDGPQQQAVGELARVVKDGGTIVVTVHHWSVAKQKSGWIKEGKPGQPGIDYIYRFSYDDFHALFPDATISAIGFNPLNRIPLIGGRVQQFASRVFGGLLAQRGHGHMLLAVTRVKKR